MTQITSYNILAGGYDIHANGSTQRTQHLLAIIRSTQPDVVGLVEATNPRATQRPLVIEQLAKALNMQLIMASEPPHSSQYQPALLTRLPILYKKVHFHTGSSTRPFLEVCVEDRDGRPFIVFVTHLSAAFNQGWAGSAIRKRELRAILQIMSQVKEKPHLLMGDFNSLAPHDVFKASKLLSYITQLDEKRKQLHISEGHPHLNGVVPYQLRFLHPLLRLIARNDTLSNAFDMAASLYAPRGTIAMMQRAGYVDCYRQLHPHEDGFTCPSPALAGRIDFIFANPLLTQRLERCDVAQSGEGVAGHLASDHLAVSAMFRDMVEDTHMGKTQEETA